MNKEIILRLAYIIVLTTLAIVATFATLEVHEYNTLLKQIATTNDCAMFCMNFACKNMNSNVFNYAIK
jgi:hypothetical protein